MKTLDLFLNFPVADVNRNVLWHDPEKVSSRQIARMNTFWGDESWRENAYQTTRNLFGYPEKEPNKVVAEAFRQRLKRVAGFERVPNPMPMKNSTGAIVYYLFFASKTDTAENIVSHIFKKYQGLMMALNSTIEWTDATWNPVRGCTKISPGCKHCYAETFAERFRGVKGHPYEQGFDLR
jgi:hypothetical protein